MTFNSLIKTICIVWAAELCHQSNFLIQIWPLSSDTQETVDLITLVFHISDLLIGVFSFKAIEFSIYYCTFSVDILWFVLCGHQSLSQTSHLHREDCVCIQRKTPPRNASPYLLNLWQCISWYVARSWESVHVNHVSENWNEPPSSNR